MKLVLHPCYSQGHCCFMEKREWGGVGGGRVRERDERERERIKDNSVYCRPHLESRVMSAVSLLESRE